MFKKLGEKKTILIVDDDQEDIEFAKKAIQYNIEDHENIDIKELYDAESLVKYLLDSNTQYPSVIFLDIKMPKISGLEVLNYIKNNERLKHIPVIMLSSSESDIIASYRKGANSYIVKPTVYNELRTIMHKMKKFWFETAELPGGDYDG